MTLNFSKQEIWDAWNEIVENPNESSPTSFAVIKKVLEQALEKE